MTATQVTLSDMVTHSEDQVYTEIDGEVVLMGIENGNYYGFDEILSRIWNIIETPTIVSNLIDQLLEEYEVDRSECEADVLSILNELHGDNLISLQ